MRAPGSIPWTAALATTVECGVPTGAGPATIPNVGGVGGGLLAADAVDKRDVLTNALAVVNLPQIQGRVGSELCVDESVVTRNVASASSRTQALPGGLKAVHFSVDENLSGQLMRGALAEEIQGFWLTSE